MEAPGGSTAQCSTYHVMWRLQYPVLKIPMPGLMLPSCRKIDRTVPLRAYMHNFELCLQALLSVNVDSHIVSNHRTKPDPDCLTTLLLAVLVRDSGNAS